jgi:hypothetical protein
MKLNLTEEQRNNVKITYDSDLFKVYFGKTGSLSREYGSVDDMMEEFHENKIQRADFDEEAHRVFNKAFKNA